ncbi:MAG: tetratricopeptide repeat protein [Opitutaceae bacterium]
MRRWKSLALLALATAAAHAHPEIEAGLTRLNAALAAEPRNADLLLERGELYARHEDWLHAEANYLAAAEIAPRHAGIARARGALALAQNRPADALNLLNESKALDPADNSGRILRARALRKLGRNDEAGNEYDRVLDRLRSPSPDLFLERAALLPPTEALTVLETALRRLGPVPGLELRALALEETLGRVDAALARLDRLSAGAERKENWLRRRGDVLLRAGRDKEARAAYAAALAALAALPDWLRDSPESVKLAKELATLSHSTPSSPP